MILINYEPWLSIRTYVGIKMESQIRIRIGIKTMPKHNTVFMSNELLSTFLSSTYNIKL